MELTWGNNDGEQINSDLAQLNAAGFQFFSGSVRLQKAESRAGMFCLFEKVTMADARRRRRSVKFSVGKGVPRL